MAGFPPGGPPQQGAPPMGMPPGAGAPPPGMPPAPPMPPRPPVAPQLGASPQPNPYSDLSIDMPPHWQLIDVASRTITTALQTGGFYKTPPVYAAFKEINASIRRLISANASGKPKSASAGTDVGGPAIGDTATPDNEPDMVDSSPDE